MSQQYGQTIKIKTSLLVFLKGSVAPVILYFDDPKLVYDNLKEIIKTPSMAKIVELDAIGPIKKICLTSTDISGVALQDEQYVVKP